MVRTFLRRHRHRLPVLRPRLGRSPGPHHRRKGRRPRCCAALQMQSAPGLRPGGRSRRQRPVRTARTRSKHRPSALAATAWSHRLSRWPRPKPPGPVVRVFAATAATATTRRNWSGRWQRRERRRQFGWGPADRRRARGGARGGLLVAVGAGAGADRPTPAASLVGRRVEPGRANNSEPRSRLGRRTQAAPPQRKPRRRVELRFD